MTLKHGKRGLITDPIAHVVTDADADLWSNQPSDAESIDIRVSLTSKYECRVRLDKYTAICLVCNLHHQLHKEMRS